MYCPSCGMEIDDNSKFCSTCGEKITDALNELGIRYQNGDQSAFQEIYSDTEPWVRSYVYNRVSTNNVEDCLQSIYIKLFENISKFDETKGPFRAWFNTLVANETIDFLRKYEKPQSKNVDSLYDEEDKVIDIVDPGMSPEDVMEKQEVARIMSEILSEISEEQRQCIMLRYMEGLKNKEIADIMGISEGTVKSRLSYGLKRVEAKVIELEKQGTKLYAMAPLPFFVWIICRGNVAGLTISGNLWSTIAASTFGMSANAVVGVATTVGGAGVMAGAGTAISAGIAAETGAVAGAQALSGAGALSGVGTAVSESAVAGTMISAGSDALMGAGTVIGEGISGVTAGAGTVAASGGLSVAAPLTTTASGVSIPVPGTAGTAGTATLGTAISGGATVTGIGAGTTATSTLGTAISGGATVTGIGVGTAGTATLGTAISGGATVTGIGATAANTAVSAGTSAVGTAISTGASVAGTAISAGASVASAAVSTGPKTFIYKPNVNARMANASSVNNAGGNGASGNNGNSGNGANGNNNTGGNGTGGNNSQGNSGAANSSGGSSKGNKKSGSKQNKNNKQGKTAKQRKATKPSKTRITATNNALATEYVVTKNKLLGKIFSLFIAFLVGFVIGKIEHMDFETTMELGIAFAAIFYIPTRISHVMRSSVLGFIVNYIVFCFAYMFIDPPMYIAILVCLAGIIDIAISVVNLIKCAILMR